MLFRSIKSPRQGGSGRIAAGKKNCDKLIPDYPWIARVFRKSMQECEGFLRPRDLLELVITQGERSVDKWDDEIFKDFDPAIVSAAGHKLLNRTAILLSANSIIRRMSLTISK